MFFLAFGKVLGLLVAFFLFRFRGNLWRFGAHICFCNEGVGSFGISHFVRQRCAVPFFRMIFCQRFGGQKCFFNESVRFFGFRHFVKQCCAVFSFVYFVLEARSVFAMKVLVFLASGIL